ncbi:uncharacterized protein CcaverHIS019_0207180 [Cutaneotrichosporon cavernicola]|uniref:U3 small nucleolar RNA-associated protein 6 N-terminal domain-containing protein n=1 Tax=Cutaneotrichosporon cavernicola TaxID=279322 RepID=A0AA48IDZ3_9TREE|nr:uncharacterized protein CcaverHIS019_0207180 [Cutaneotrichosporon cavernicola]BEI89356.1 hypothetical protein CcaverHIS019_0207180 [Cutaneotrichosporon cavernicola]BEI97131.1 hypothetical protein CcaverHIS631_0207200 [Cutaneotrichosporon cavernicola]BEJ04904.1 hypothetical protein CcaverHIS641_0207210 [Cutaneotrichosporon cavernicola]
MEKVQFQLEATLPELKDLYDKGLFSKHEIDQITKRRTAFETSLIRLKTRKDDFFKYAEYEINLERLRKVRWKKCGYHVNPPAPSASTYSLPRRTLYILKRATTKFPGDLAVWLAYVEYAAHQGMTKIVAKGLTLALQHHPLSPTLYLLLAHHHLHPGDPLPRAAIPSSSANPLDLPQRREGTSTFSLEGTGPARTTLLLGLRVLSKSHTLWQEYAKLELGWVEGLRRRWRVLGLTENKESVDFDGDVDALVGGDGAFGPEGEDARRAILSGQLVVHALESALNKVQPGDEGRDAGADPTVAADGMAFREGLLEMLRSYPSPLRKSALRTVYADLERITAKGGRDGARARLALVTRPLYDRAYEAGQEEKRGIVLEGVELVDALGVIGKEMRSVAKKAGSEWTDIAGAWLAERIAEAGDNADLQRYLLSTLKALTKPSLAAPPSLLLRHLDLVKTLDPESYLATARSHAAQHPEDADLALARVRAEVEDEEDQDEVLRVCAETAKTITRSGLSDEAQDAVASVWLEWAEFEDEHTTDPAASWKKILAASLRAPLPSLHPAMLAAYFAAELARGADPSATLDKLVRGYHPTPAFFAPAFEALIDAGAHLTPSGGEDAAAHLYRAWRGSCRADGDRVYAALSYVEHLLTIGRGRDAHVVVETARREVADATVLEEGWMRLVDAAERQMSEDESEDEDEEMDQDEESGSESEGSEGSEESGDLEMTF